MKLRTLAISVLGATFLPFSIAAAAQITYAFTGTATGTIAGKSFSNVSFSVTAVADTADVPAPTAGVISFTPTSVTINNSASSQPVTVPSGYIFDNQNLNSVGFGEGQDDITFSDPSFATYNLKTSTGPFFEASDPSISDWVNMPTSKGDLTVTSLTNLSFSATLSSSTTTPTAVPAPSAAGLSLAGLSILCAIAAYRRSAAARTRQA
jgi:hypothetical protein